MTEALIVSIFFCIFFIYKWVYEETKRNKEALTSASAMLASLCVIDQLLEYKMEKEDTIILSFNVESIRDFEKFIREFDNKYSISNLDDKVTFHHNYKNL